MNGLPPPNYRLILLSLIIALTTISCAGKDKPTPVEVEKEAFASLRAEVGSVISDPERAGQVLVVIGELEESFDDLREHLIDRKASIKALNADYDAPRSDFITLFEGIQTDMARNQGHISVIHRKLFDLTTAAEWEELSKSTEPAMEAAIQSIQSI